MQMSKDVTKARRDLYAPASFGGGGGCGGGGCDPNWGGACQNFIAATNVAALGTVTFAGTPVSKGFAVAGMASFAAAGVTCAAAMASGQQSQMW